jgi:hypothetical protein
LTNKSSLVILTPEAVFSTLHFLRNLGIGSLS